MIAKIRVIVNPDVEGCKKGEVTRPAGGSVMLRGLVIIASGLCLALSIAGSVSAAVQYRVTDIGDFGGSYSNAYGINAIGQVVGCATTSDGKRHAFLYSDGALTDLDPVLGDTGTSTAYAINDSGHIAGEAGHHAFHYYGGTVTNLGVASGYNCSRATAINANGQVVGYSYVNRFLNPSFPSQLHPCQPHTTQILDLYGGPGGGCMIVMCSSEPPTSSSAAVINSDGTIVGFHGNPLNCYMIYFTSIAFMYSDETRMDLSAFGGNRSLASGINDDGVVVGSANDSDGYEHAFLYDGTLNDLHSHLSVDGMFLYDGETTENLTAYSDDSAGRFFRPYGMNDHDEVVGAGFGATGSPHACLYSDGIAVDLNTLIDPISGWQLTHARAINDSGWIVGMGTNAEGEDHAFLLTPIPEPCTGILAAIGLVAMLLAGWRRRIGSANRREC